jgi:hypothetical protein
MLVNEMNSGSTEVKNNKSSSRNVHLGESLKHSNAVGEIGQLIDFDRDGHEAAEEIEDGAGSRFCYFAHDC